MCSNLPRTMIGAILCAVMAAPFSSRPLAAESLAPQMVLQVGHSAEISALAASTDGATLVSGAQDGLVKVWNLATAWE